MDVHLVGEKAQRDFVYFGGVVEDFVSMIEMVRTKADDVADSKQQPHNGITLCSALQSAKRILNENAITTQYSVHDAA